MVPRFESSTKNKPMLVLNNFKYTHYNKNNHQVSHWRCVQYHKGCRAQIKTYNDKIVNNANQIHNHGLASSATASRPRIVSATTSKAKTNLNQKIATLQKLLNAKSSKNSSNKDEDESNSCNEDDESDSCEHSSNKDNSDSGEHSSIEDDSDSSKHSSDKDESDSIKHTSSKKEKDRPHKIFNKNKKPTKWVKW